MKEKVLAVRGVGGYRQYRIPALAVTPSGRIIAIYDARFDFDDLPSPIDLVIRTSDDNGETWSEQAIFREHDGVSGYGDASIIVDPNYGKQGKVIVLYQYTQHAGFFESSTGTDLNDPLIAQICISTSDDDGNTWSHGYITDQLKSENLFGIFATSGMGGVITHGSFVGRLLQTFVLRDSELYSAIGFSDDHGKTWSLGAKIPGGNETAITSLNDGSILFHSRGTPFRLSGRSFDGGQTIVDFGPDQALPDPSDNGSLTTLRNGELICTHNNDSSLRMNTVLKKSRDGGMSWPEQYLLEKGSSAYSTACELRDGSIGVLFERNAYVEMVFMKIELNEFMNIEDDKGSIEDDAKLTIIPRFIRPGRTHTNNQLKVKSPTVPEVDMGVWRASERKEVGAVGGSTSGDVLYTTDELNEIMGAITPGLHINDEIRISGKLENKSKDIFNKVSLRAVSGATIKEQQELLPGSSLTFLDYRQTVSVEDIERGYVEIAVKWLEDEDVKGVERLRLSIESGLPIR